jgi:hypothetical protein
MDPNHVHNFCANMFAITGRQVDQLRGLLSGSTVNVTPDASTITDNTLPNITETTPHLTHILAFLFLIMTMYMMYKDGNTRKGKKGAQSGENTQNRLFDRDRRDDEDMAT